MINELGSTIEFIRCESRVKNFVLIFSPCSVNTVTHEIGMFALSIADSKIWGSLFLEWLISLAVNDISCFSFLLKTWKQKRISISFKYF